MNTQTVNNEKTTTTGCCDSTCCSTSAIAAEENAVSELVGGALAEEARLKEIVRSYYAERAVSGTSCCGPSCGCGTSDDFDRISAAVGYSVGELQAVPEGANLGLGCGNPTAIDAIAEGETVLDLGSGAGFDCFLAARKVGPTGRVIGVDMTPEMVERARANAEKAGITNVEFRLGEIERLPVEDASVDVVISNCVINLSPNKPRVFAEAFRVLKPGGRLMVSDLVLTRDLPEFIKQSAEAYAGCISGAERKYRYLAMIEEAGFSPVQVTGEGDYLSAISDGADSDWIPDALRAEAIRELGGISPVVSLKVLATRPG